MRLSLRLQIDSDHLSQPRTDTAIARNPAERAVCWRRIASQSPSQISGFQIAREAPLKHGNRLCDQSFCDYDRDRNFDPAIQRTKIQRRKFKVSREEGRLKCMCPSPVEHSPSKQHGSQRCDLWGRPTSRPEAMPTSGALRKKTANVDGNEGSEEC